MNPERLTETVLVTGASSGIGLELARCFAADGSRLVLVARNTSALEQLAGKLRGDFKIEATVLTADLSRNANFNGGNIEAVQMSAIEVRNK